MSNSNTPYDDVFRTMENDCPHFLIPVINEVFGTEYAQGTQVLLSQNEHFIRDKDGQQKRRITDSNFIIEDVPYQIECQSVNDGSMVIREWEYNSQIALENRTFTRENGNLFLKFPHAAVLCLRHNKNTQDFLTIIVQFPENTSTYRIPMIKIKEYDIESIFEKQLFFFIPFYLFVYEERFPEYEQDERKLSELKEAYEKLYECLRERPVEELTTYEKKMLIDMSKIVLESLAKNYPKIKKGLGDIMGGQVLNYPTKEILMRGRAEGRAEGRTEGRVEMLFNLVQKGILTIAIAAAEALKSEEEFEAMMMEWEKNSGRRTWS